MKDKYLNDFDVPVKNPSSVEKKINSLKKSLGNLNTLSNFENINVFETGRHVEETNIQFDDLICTTYFTSKIDPQRKHINKSDDIKYIAPWYKSMKSLGLQGIVFYDTLSKEFVKKYQTEKIIFLKCKLGEFSLNDERFIIYYLFLLANKLNNVLFTDGNDVIINKPPFPFLKTKRQSTIFVGRGKENKLYHSKWNVKSIKKLEAGLNVRLPNNFYEMAIYNAGIIGGNYFTSLYFPRQICSVFFRVNNDKNNNMAAMHYVLYYYFYPNCRKGAMGWFNSFTDLYFKIRLFKKIESLQLYFLNNSQINYKKDTVALARNIFSGFPLNSDFYSFQSNSTAYIIHK